MTENMGADVQQSRQAVFVRCCLKYFSGKVVRQRTTFPVFSAAVKGGDFA
jgi:hypothetical protein